MNRIKHARQLCATALVAGAALISAWVPASPAAPAGAGAGVACSAIGITVQSMQTPVFYIDATSSPAFTSSYVGYRVTNSSAAGSVVRPWVQVAGFTGGVVAAAANEPGAVPLDTGGTNLLSSGAADTAYFYLNASGPTTIDQTHEVRVFEGRPGTGGVEVCRETFTIDRVEDVIKAAANKVTGSSGVPSSIRLGQTFSFTVTGETGTVGAGYAFDPSIIRFSPATSATWPSGAFRLIDSTFNISLDGSAAATDHPHTLALGGAAGANRAYSVTYTLQAVGATAASTSLTPVQNIASGTQVKHTDPGTLASLPPLPVVTNQLTISGQATPGATPSDPVTITVTIHNAGSTPAQLDAFQFNLPGDWAVDTGSVASDGSPLPDPSTSGGVSTFTGPFDIPASGDKVITLTISGGTAGYGSLIGMLGDSQIDQTLNLSDDSPYVFALDGSAAPTLPFATDDSMIVAQPGPRTADVLGNDTLGGVAAGADDVVTTIVSGPAHGTASVTVTDGIQYTPTAGYTGSDSVTYQIAGGDGTDTAVLSITVIAEPAAAADTAATFVDVPVDIAVLDNDSVAGDTPVIAITAQPAHGTVTINADGTITYTPDAGYEGSDGFTYSVTVGGQTRTASVAVTVAAPILPIATDDSMIVAQPGPRTADVLGNDTLGGVAAGADDVVTTIVSGPAHGTASVSVTDGIQYTPTAGYTGSDSVTYQIAGGDGTDTAVLSITVIDEPAAVADVASTLVGVAVDIAVLSNDSVAGDTPVIAITAQPAHGIVTINADGTITYTPDPGYVGPDAVTYSVTVGGQTRTAQVTIAVHLPPMASNDRARTPFGQPALIDVVDNDTFDGPVISLVVTRAPAHGTVQIVGGVVVYTPEAGFAGDDDFAYAVTTAGGIDTAEVTITVIPSAPSPPRDVVVTGTLGVVTVSWQPPLSNGGRSITGYRVLDRSGRTVCEVGGDVLSCDVRGSDAFGASYTVVALNDVGSSSDGAVMVRTPYEPGQGPPRDVRVAPGDRVLLVAWRVPLQRDGLVGYRVRVNGRILCRTTTLRCKVRMPEGRDHQVRVEAVYGTRARGAGRRVGLSGVGAAGAASVRVYFDVDRWSIKPGAQLWLARFAGDARVLGVERLVLTGHTDAWGTWDYNRRLSVRRVLSVQRYLQSRLPGVEIRVEWRSEDDPAVRNVQDRRWKNRRVMVRVAL